jgi:hypothetical protein
MPTFVDNVRQMEQAEQLFEMASRSDIDFTVINQTV